MDAGKRHLIPTTCHHPHKKGAAIDIIETGSPDLVDTAVGVPQLVVLGLHPLTVVRKQAPGMLLDVDLASLRVEARTFLVHHIGARVRPSATICSWVTVVSCRRVVPPRWYPPTQPSTCSKCTGFANFCL